MKKHIPNFITLLNLSSGSAALFMVLNGQYQWALGLLLAAAVFDFFDGFVARLLSVQSEVGKQLDSLADLVSFGLVPASMIFIVLQSSILQDTVIGFTDLKTASKILLISTVMVPVLSAIRLAKFNVQKDTNDFIGLPTPAFALFWAGIYYDLNATNTFFGQPANEWIFWSLMVVISLFLIAPLPMMSLKFKNFNFLANFYRYLLIFIAVIILIFTGIQGLSVIVLTYILLSLVRIVLT